MIEALLASKSNTLLTNVWLVRLGLVSLLFYLGSESMAFTS